MVSLLSRLDLPVPARVQLAAEHCPPSQLPAYLSVLWIRAVQLAEQVHRAPDLVGVHHAE